MYNRRKIFNCLTVTIVFFAFISFIVHDYVYAQNSKPTNDLPSWIPIVASGVTAAGISALVNYVTTNKKIESENLNTIRKIQSEAQTTRDNYENQWKNTIRESMRQIQINTIQDWLNL